MNIYLIYRNISYYILNTASRRDVGKALDYRTRGSGFVSGITQTLDITHHSCLDDWLVLFDTLFTCVPLLKILDHLTIHKRMIGFKSLYTCARPTFVSENELRVIQRLLPATDQPDLYRRCLASEHVTDTWSTPTDCLWAGGFFDDSVHHTHRVTAGRILETRCTIKHWEVKQGKIQ